MAIINTIETHSWPDLVSKIDFYFTHFDSYIFRGQADATWGLEPTLTRALKKYTDPARKEFLIFEHLENFKKNIRGRAPLEYNMASDNDFWALGQHFGLYTPLLDWSLSPYISLFFSLLGECQSGRRILWAVVKNDLIEISKTKPINQKIDIFEPLSHYNNRLISQRGLFSKIPVNVAFEQWISDSPDYDWITVFKILYPDEIKNEIFAALNNRNINHFSLFPEAIGSCLHSNYMLDISDYLEQQRNAIRGFDK